MKLEASTIAEFFDNAGDKRAGLMQLDEIIMRLFPQVKRQLYVTPSMTLLGYGGAEPAAEAGAGSWTATGWPMIGIAPQKHTINLYLGCEPGETPLTELYKERLGKVSVGKSCIRITSMEKIHVEALEALVTEVLGADPLQQHPVAGASAGE